MSILSDAFDYVSSTANSLVSYVSSAVQFDPARGTVTIGDPSGVQARQAAVKAQEQQQQQQKKLDTTTLLMIGGGVLLLFVVLSKTR